MGEPAKKLDFGADAMLAGLLEAPLSGEPLTEEERTAFDEAERWASLRALPVRTEAFTPEEEAAFEEAERFMTAGEQGKSTDEIEAVLREMQHG